MNPAIIIIDCWYNTEIVPNIINYINTLDNPTIVIACYDNRSPDPRLTHATSNNCVYHLTQLADFKKLAELSNIDTVVIVGTAWQECVHNRPLGLYALRANTSLQVLTNPACCQRMYSDEEPSVSSIIDLDPEFEVYDNIHYRML